MKKEVQELIRSDFFRYGIRTFSGRVLLWKLLSDPTLRFLVFYRLGHDYWRRGRKIRLFLLRVLRKAGIVNDFHSDIPLAAEFGPGLYLGHFNSITVNALAKFGKNINLHKGATIGQENRGSRKGVPVIGNNVYIGINSTVVGKITIGDNVLIAPNCHVNFDIPSDSIVCGNPAVIRHNRNATEYYVEHVC